MPISYEELRICWVKGCRNGNVRMLTRIQRAHYRACLLLARRLGRIISTLLVKQLRAVMDVLLSSPRVKALKAGLERAREIIRGNILSWAPQVRRWLQEEAYILYLGFMKLNTPACFRL